MRYRYHRLLYAPMRSWQIAVTAVGTAVPVTVGALLIWALFESSAAPTVGFYFVIVGLEAAALWFATSPLYISSHEERRGEDLRILLLEALNQANAKKFHPVGEPITVAAFLGLGSTSRSAELALTCACRKPCPRHATRRYSLIRPPMRACLRTR
jgi:hypothetical protein